MWVFQQRFDGDLVYLKALHKRVNAFADDKAIPDKTSKLWCIWSNIKAMLCETDADYYVEVMYFTSLMAKKIDEYSNENMLTGDPTIAKILYELDVIKPCDYSCLELNE